jgi:hypothetical protein
MKIIDTDNFGGDYPNEKFVNVPRMNPTQAAELCALLNTMFSGETARRIWQVVPDDYELQPGFEP